jgi:hypothetical protein
MTKRSEINKVADGHKATATKIALWGEGDLSRAAKMAQWTKEHLGSDPTLNPFSRSKYYRDGRPPPRATQPNLLGDDRSEG